ncbi:hypothetical protein BH11PSE1_BH11PSE1_06390 [soil metagenome]
MSRGSGAEESAVLAFDALDTDEVVLNAPRRRALLQAYEEAAKQQRPPPVTQEAVTAAKAQVDLLRARLLVLGPRAAQAGDAASISQASAEVEAEHARAIAAARDARTEATRLVETERARLLNVRKAQAQYQQALVNRVAATSADRESALVWRRRVLDMSSRSLLDPTRTADADQLYMSLVDALREVRARLWTSFGEVVGPAAPPAPAPLDPALDAAGAEARPLLALHASIAAEASRLGGASRETQWQQVVALREAMVVMNDARLKLIPQLSPSLHAQVLGFGRLGLAQTQRELEQITLEAQFNLLLAPRVVANLATTIRGAAAGAAVVALELAAAGFAFRLWRRRGGALIRALQRSLERRRPPSFFATLGARGLGYAYAARRPLDWLLLLLLLARMVPTDLRFPGVDYLWMVAVWVLLADLVVRMTEAAWRVRSTDPPAKLRRWTIRLVAWTLAMLGLILSLTHAIVGAGALYNWALSASWFAVVPGVFLLLHWWRDRIDTLAAAGADRNLVLAWAARSHVGPVAFAGRAAAAAVLLAVGARGEIARRANQVALLRELFDHTRRRRTEAAVRADAQSGRFDPLPDAAMAALSPHREPIDLSGQIVREGLAIQPGEIIAIVGERGLGKTTRLAQMAQVWGERSILRVSAPGSWPEILEALSEGLKAKSAREVDVSAALRRGGPWLVCIDDAQTLVRPVISGLEAFNRLVNFARSQGRNAAWTISVGSLAWEYVERACDNRALVDDVRHLPRWSERMIAALAERRTEQAALRPRFDGLQLPTPVPLIGELDRNGRTNAAYFQLLTDYAHGNPAIALELWRRSLRIETSSGDTVVRMFPTPPVEDLDALPASVYFVLRALLRLDIADEAALAQTTNLPAPVVADAMRRLEALGALERLDGRSRISLFWRRESVRALERLNMLSTRP